jgi:hypothetical protein
MYSRMHAVGWCAYLGLRHNPLSRIHTQLKRAQHFLTKEERKARRNLEQTRLTRILINLEYSSVTASAYIVEVVLRHFHRCRYMSSTAVVLLLKGLRSHKVLVIREHGGHEDLRGSGHRNVIPYIHG